MSFSKKMQNAGLQLSNFTEKWFPDSLAFAFLGILITFVIGLSIGERPYTLIYQGGKSFWSLIPFTLQMVMVILGGYVVATAPVVSRLIQHLASIPKSPRSAVTWIAFFSMISSLLSWGFSLIFSALLVKALAKRLPKMDYRAAAASAYLGLGAIWALGLSSSAALMMASKDSIPAKLLEISGVLSLNSTLFTWQNALMVLCLIAVSLIIAHYSSPESDQAKTASDFGVSLEDITDSTIKSRPGEYLDYHVLFHRLIALMLTLFLFWDYQQSGQGVLSLLDLNRYNLIFLVLGLWLHPHLKSFTQSVYAAVPASASVLIQFPFYGFIFGMIVGTSISHFFAELFITLSNAHTYPLLVALYSAVLGVFIPSGGSKWIMEAPYVLQAAKEHGLHLGWVVQIYNAAEALPNLINPFWMLPLLGILQIKARDVVGFCFLQLIWHVPLVFFLCWYLASSF